MKAASKKGFTPLVFAALKDKAATVKVLLAAGADPNFALPDGTKVLFVAVANKSDGAATALLDAGTDPNIQDHSGTTPLHTAAQAGNLELTKKLLAHGSNVNARTGKSKGGGNRLARLLVNKRP